MSKLRSLAAADTSLRQMAQILGVDREVLERHKALILQARGGKKFVMAGKKGRSGRPKGSGKPVDLSRLHALALIGLPVTKIAFLLGVSCDTLERRFRPQIEAGRTDGEQQLLQTAFKFALEGNTRIMELCLINRCGWANRPEVAVSVVQNTIALPNITEQTKEKLAQLHQLIRREALLGTPEEVDGNGETVP